MRLRGVGSNSREGVVVVIAITANGFKYDREDGDQADVMAGVPIVYLGQGREHFGYNGCALFERIE